ncbi:MAG: mechanosensitive ion channel [Marinilabiliaceae bacterium]|nr:mechanosensitive ion channel [Marinilabiliaceae bacterium]
MLLSIFASLYSAIASLLGVESGNGVLQMTCALVVVVLVTLIFYYLSKYIFTVLLKRIIKRSKTKIDDYIFTDDVLKRISLLVPILVLLKFRNLFVIDDLFQSFYNKVFVIAFAASLARLISSLLRTCVDAFYKNGKMKEHPLNGVRQLLTVIIYTMLTVFIIATILDKSPRTILTGLGASAAVLSIVFKDVLVGFVAGIQLSLNKMVSVGDWIDVPKHKANGVVQEISVSTVKIKNWDETITTVPPTLLLNDSFCNWKGMQQAGGRRVTRSLNIDMHSVRNVTEEELEYWEGDEMIAEVVEKLKTRKPSPTNLELYRAYLLAQLRQDERVNQNMTVMVRTLEPTQYGVPVELYFFSLIKRWEEYEEVQAQMLENMIALASRFGLEVYMKH